MTHYKASEKTETMVKKGGKDKLSCLSSQGFRRATKKPLQPLSTLNQTTVRRTTFNKIDAFIHHPLNAQWVFKVTFLFLTYSSFECG